MDGVRNGTLDSHYQSVFHGYIEQTKKRPEDAWAPEVQQIAVYRHSKSKGDNSSEDGYWERIQDDLSTYLEEDYGFPEEADETLPVVADHQMKTEREYRPGGFAVSTTLRPDPDDGPWMTSTITKYDENNPGDRYGTGVEYLGEDEARAVVRWLLDDGQMDKVIWMMKKGIEGEKGAEDSHDEQIQAFAAEMAKAGEIDAARDVKTWAEQEHYPDEAGYVRAGITEGLEHGINSSDD